MVKSSSLIAMGLLASAGMAASEFIENFDSISNWKQASDLDKYSGIAVTGSRTTSSDTAMLFPEKAKHYGLVADIDTVDPSKGKTVLQFELEMSEGQECGGGYLKFLQESPGADLNDSTGYAVMFGPDKCGATNKVHLIIRHKNANTGEYEEKHLNTAPKVKGTDKKTHMYTAILDQENNTYQVLVDNKVEKEGSLFEDFTPSFQPSSQINDPEDKKPEDWVDAAEIPDPDSTKPDDWDEEAPPMIPDTDVEKPVNWLDDEPASVPDPSASKPDDWDEDEDGEWTAPMVSNPNCDVEDGGCGEWKPPLTQNPDFKGPWSAPMIENPEYIGKWGPQKIDNPDYYVVSDPLADIGKIEAVAIEIWTMSEGLIFDNVYVGNSVEKAAEIADQMWKPVHDAQIKAEEEAQAAVEAEADNLEADDSDDVVEEFEEDSPSTDEENDHDEL